MQTHAKSHPVLIIDFMKSRNSTVTVFAGNLMTKTTRLFVTPKHLSITWYSHIIRCYCNKCVGKILLHPRTAARHVQKYGLTCASTANQLAVLAHRLCPSHDTNHIDLSAMSSTAHGITVPNVIDDLDFDSSNPPIMVIENIMAYEWIPRVTFSRLFPQFRLFFCIGWHF